MWRNPGTELAPEETGIAMASIRPVSNSVPAWIEVEETCRSSPGIGIMVFSVSSGQVLFENQAASRYVNLPLGRENSVRPAIIELVHRMITQMATDSREPVQLEPRELAAGPGRPVLVQVFGIPYGSESQRSRVVVTVRR